jgi:hypothetical protein
VSVSAAPPVDQHGTALDALRASLRAGHLAARQVEALLMILLHLDSSARLLITAEVEPSASLAGNPDGFTAYLLSLSEAPVRASLRALDDFAVPDGHDPGPDARS